MIASARITKMDLSHCSTITCTSKGFVFYSPQPLLQVGCNLPCSATVQAAITSTVPQGSMLQTVQYIYQCPECRN